MIAIAISATAISVLRTTPVRIGGWEAAIVSRESYPLIMLFLMDELADSYPYRCNSCRWDAVYEVRSSAVVALTAISGALMAEVVALERSQMRTCRERRS